MFCANMDGSDKVPLLCIGKSQKPRSFRGHLTLPTEYKANSKAWMTSDIFMEWLRKLDRKMSLQRRKIPLLLDNCSAHPKTVSGLKSVRMFFLPPNCTSVLQPMDQGIIRCFKHHYKTAINKMNKEALDNGTEFSLSLLKALREAQCAWAKVTPETISNCWLHMAFGEYGSPKEFIAPENDQPGLSTDEFEEFVHIDDELITSDIPSDEDIVQEVRGIQNEEESDQEEGEGEIEDDPIPSNREMKEICRKMRRYTEALKNTQGELESLTLPSGEQDLRCIKETNQNFEVYKLRKKCLVLTLLYIYVIPVVKRFSCKSAT